MLELSIDIYYQFKLGQKHAYWRANMSVSYTRAKRLGIGCALSASVATLVLAPMSTAQAGGAGVDGSMIALSSLGVASVCVVAAIGYLGWKRRAKR
jgi:hypothetical protein